MSTPTEAENSRAQLASYLRYSKDPWAFLRDCVFTLDQVDRKSPIKPFPSHFEYLEYFTNCWTHELKIAVPKSRRMTMSWTCIGLYLWDTIFHRGRFNGFVSKKEDDAAELVARAEFILTHIPPERIPKALLPKIKNGKMSKQPPVLEFEEIGSKIQGFPMGSDQLRQFTLSGILGDECAFWEDAQRFYSASIPTTEGGGRITLISSRSPGFFKKIVFDKLDEITLDFPEVAPAEIKKPIPGIEIWKNPANGFLIFDCHYSANPAKRSPEWVETIRSSMPIRDFLMEYEKSWHTFEGLPVFADFNKALHVSQYGLTPRVGLPLLIGWDFGLTPAAVIGQICEGQLFIYKEFIGTNEGIVKFAPKVWNFLRTNFTAWTHNPDSLINFIDPAGFAKNQVDERTCANALREAGFRRVEPGPIDWESRREAIEYFLLRQTKQGSALLIDPKLCPTLVEGFAGGYRFSDSAKEIEKQRERPLKDRYSHPHDALQYLAHGAQGKLRQYAVSIPAPEYSFLKRTKPEKTA